MPMVERHRGSTCHGFPRVETGASRVAASAAGNRRRSWRGACRPSAIMRSVDQNDEYPRPVRVSPGFLHCHYCRRGAGARNAGVRRVSSAGGGCRRCPRVPCARQPQSSRAMERKAVPGTGAAVPDETGWRRPRSDQQAGRLLRLPDRQGIEQETRPAAAPESEHRPAPVQPYSRQSAAALAAGEHQIIRRR